MAKDIHKLALEHANFVAPKPSMMELPAGLLAAGFAATVIAIYDAALAPWLCHIKQPERENENFSNA